MFIYFDIQEHANNLFLSRRSLNLCQHVACNLVFIQYFKSIVSSYSIIISDKHLKIKLYSSLQDFKNLMTAIS